MLQISFGYMHAEIWQLHNYRCSQRTEKEGDHDTLKEYFISNKRCRMIVLTTYSDSGKYFISIKNDNSNL